MAFISHLTWCLAAQNGMHHLLVGGSRLTLVAACTFSESEWEDQPSQSSAVLIPLQSLTDPMKNLPRFICQQEASQKHRLTWKHCQGTSRVHAKVQ